MSIAYPLAFLFPLLIAILYLLNRGTTHAVNYPSLSELVKISPSWRIRLRKPVLSLLSALFVVCLALAAARPQKVTTLQEDYKSRNIMLALDVSKSMGTQDFKSRGGFVQRLEAVKAVLDEFIHARERDRIGLVVFGSSGFLQAPLTRDHNLVRQMIDRLEVGLAGDGTAIGDGLGLSIKRIADIPTGAKAIILLTDGVNNSGQVNPSKASLVAKDLGIKVHTVGIGTNATLASPGFGDLLMGARPMRAEFDEALLKEIANATGGVYFNASDIEGLTKVYEEIDKLEETESEEPERRIVDELFLNFAAGALFAYLAYLVFSQTIFLKTP
jgi:Ca-activated chloride channel homolog